MDIGGTSATVEYNVICRTDCRRESSRNCCREWSKQRHALDLYPSIVSTLPELYARSNADQTVLNPTLHSHSWHTQYWWPDITPPRTKPPRSTPLYFTGGTEPLPPLGRFCPGGVRSSHNANGGTISWFQWMKNDLSPHTSDTPAATAILHSLATHARTCSGS